MELTIVVLIMAILALLGMDAIAEFEAAQRPDRAARETLAWFRYARALAMSTGKKTEVVVDTSNRLVTIYWNTNGTTRGDPYTSGATNTGYCILNMDSAAHAVTITSPSKTVTCTPNREIMGTAVSVNNSATYFEYNALGNCTLGGTTAGTSSVTVSFTYGGKSKTLVVGKVGDPQLQ